LTILAIDPGRDTGWCLMSEARELRGAGLGDPPLEFVGHRVVVERPQIYPRSKGDPNDLITLAIQVGRYSERFLARGCAVEEILPHTWKGTVDPDILCRRVWASLTAAEQALLGQVLEPLARTRFSAATLTDGKRHNVIDAVGLAKWSLKRARAGVFE
jgi:hypothetical protein